MKKIITALLMIIAISQAYAVGNFIFSIKISEKEGQVKFLSEATDIVSKGGNAQISWLVKKPGQGFSILLNGSPVSSSPESNYVFTMNESATVKIALFDLEKNRVVEEHSHHIKVFGIPVINSLSVDKQLVKVGSNITLSWTGENLGTVKFDKQLLSQYENSAFAKVAQDTTYTMTATSPTGETATKSVSVKVGDFIPEVTSMTADASEIFLGESVTIDWTSKDSLNVDMYINGSLAKSDMPINGSTTYAPTIYGDVTIELRAKDKYYGLYGENKSLSFKVKQSINWDFAPRVLNTTSISARQSIDMKWATGNLAESISARYLTSSNSQWVDLPISDLDGDYSLVIDDKDAHSITIEFNQKRKDGSIVTERVYGSLIGAEIDTAEVSLNEAARINIKQGINYPVYIYVNNQYNRTAYNGISAVVLNTSGENKIEVRTSKSGSAVAEFTVAVLPTWLRAPSSSHAVVYAGDLYQVAWSIQSPFNKAKLTRVSGGNKVVVHDLSASDSYEDSLAEGESFVTYSVEVETESGVTRTSSTSVYLLEASFTESEVSFGQSFTLKYLSTTPSLSLYIDDVRMQSLSGSSAAINGLSMGAHKIEVRSTFGAIPANNRVWSKTITVLPSANIEIQSDFSIVQIGKEFNWSWYVPEMYDTVEVYETQSGVKTLISNEHNAKFTSVMKSRSYPVLEVVGKKDSGATQTKSKTIYPFEIVSVSKEILERGDFNLQTFSPGSSLSVKINGKPYVGSIGQNTNISYTNFAIGSNEVMLTLQSAGQTSDFLFYVNRVGLMTLASNYFHLPANDLAEITWDLPLEYKSVKIKNGTQEISTSHAGSTIETMSAYGHMNIVATGEMESGLTATKNTYVYFYDVALPAEINSNGNFEYNIRSQYGGNFKVYINGSIVNTVASNANYVLNYYLFRDGLNKVVFEPENGNGKPLEKEITKLEKPALAPVINYNISPPGTTITFDWDIPTAYVDVKITENVGGVSKVVSTSNSGHHEFIKSNNHSDTINFTAKSQAGTVYSGGLSAYALSVTNVADDLTDSSQWFYTYSSPWGRAKAYVNGNLYTINTSNGTKAIPSNAFKLGENMVSIADESTGKFKSFTKTVTLMDRPDTSFNYTTLPAGEDLTFSWDIPEGYVDVKVEVDNGSGKQVVSTNNAGRNTAPKSKNTYDNYYITAKTANGVILSRQYSASIFDISVDTNEIITDGPVLKISGPIGGHLYINGIYKFALGANSTNHLSVSQFNEGLNQIEVRAASGNSPVWTYDITKLSQPDFTTQYYLLPVGDEVSFSWSVDNSFGSVEVETRVKGVLSTVSTSFSGTYSFVKSNSADYAYLKLVSKNGETGLITKTFYPMIVGPIKKFVSPTESLTFTVDTPWAGQVTSRPTSDVPYAELYINNALIHTFAGNNRSINMATTIFAEGDNQLRIKSIYGALGADAKDFTATVTSLGKGTIESDFAMYPVGELVNVRWDIPSEYDSVSVTLLSNSKEINVSTLNSGSYQYEKNGLNQKVQIKAQSETGAQLVNHLISYPMIVSMAPEFESGGPVFSFELAANGNRADLYVNGIKRMTLSGKVVNGSVPGSYFNDGENDVEIIPLSVGSFQGMSWKGKVVKYPSMSIKSSYTYATSGDVVQFDWLIPEMYSDVRVEVNINGVRKDISSDHNGSYVYKKSEGSDAIYLSGKAGGISVKKSASISPTPVSISRLEISPTESIHVKAGLAAAWGPAKLYLNNKLMFNFIDPNASLNIFASNLVAGDNEIRIEYHDDFRAMPYVKTIRLLPAASVGSNYPAMHIGELAEFKWNVPDEYTSVSVAVKIHGQPEKIISTDSSGSYGYLKEMGMDTIRITMKNDNGVLYVVGNNITAFSVMAPAVIGRENAQINYAGSYPGFKVYVNDILRHTSTLSNGGVSLPNGYFNEGENIVKIVPSYSNYEQNSLPWIGRVIKNTN